jgi:hypothetical protein
LNVDSDKAVGFVEIKINVKNGTNSQNTQDDPSGRAGKYTFVSHDTWFSRILVYLFINNYSFKIVNQISIFGFRPEVL